MSDALPTQSVLKTRRSFNSISFQLCFRICHQKGPRKWGRTGTEWNTSAPVHVDGINALGKHINTKNSKTDALSETSREVGLEVITKQTKYMVLSPLECRIKS